MNRAPRLLVLLVLSTPVFGQDAASYGDSLGPLFTESLPGSFRMGSSNGQRDERPVHMITLTKHYEIGTYDVNRSPGYAVMNATGGPDIR